MAAPCAIPRCRAASCSAVGFAAPAGCVTGCPVAGVVVAVLLGFSVQPDAPPKATSNKRTASVLYFLPLPLKLEHLFVSKSVNFFSFLSFSHSYEGICRKGRCCRTPCYQGCRHYELPYLTAVPSYLFILSETDEFVRRDTSQLMKRLPDRCQGGIGKNRAFPVSVTHD